MCNNTLSTLMASTVNAIYNSCTHTDGSGACSRGPLLTVPPLFINSCQPGGGLYYWPVAMLVPRKHCSIIITTSKKLYCGFAFSPGPSRCLRWPPSPSLLSVVNLNTGGFIPPHRCLFYNKRSSSFVRRHKRDHHQGWGQTIRQTDGQRDGWRYTLALG